MIAANEAAISHYLSASRSSFTSHLTNSLLPIDIQPSSANEAFSQLLFTFLMHPRSNGSPLLEQSAWFAPIIHSYKRSAAGGIAFDSHIDAQLRTCLASSLLKLSGIAEIWRAKKSPAERDSVCRQLQALRSLGLCDVTGHAAKRIGDAVHCGGFIEATQSECIAEFKRCSAPLVQQLMQLFCSFWVEVESPSIASQVTLSVEGEDWSIGVTFAGTEVAASISTDQLHKLQRMYVPGHHAEPAAADPHDALHRFMEHVFACVSR